MHSKEQLVSIYQIMCPFQQQQQPSFQNCYITKEYMNKNINFIYFLYRVNYYSIIFLFFFLKLYNFLSCIMYITYPVYTLHPHNMNGF